MCKKCGASSAALSDNYEEADCQQEAIAAWNRRAEQNNTPLALDEIISRCTPKAAELLKNGLLGAIKVCALEKTTPKTNADRIRSMSDEELAKELTRNPAIPCRMCEYYNHKLSYCDAPNDFACVTAYAEALTLDWLKQPVKEE